MTNDIITLKNSEWAAKICPRPGANIIALKYREKDVLRPLEDEKQLENNPYVFGSPILMPANRTYKGKFTVEGKEYNMPLNEPQNNCHLHGLVLFQSFETLDVTADTAVLRINDGKCTSYPFPYALTVHYSLTDNGLLSSYELENIGQGNMPFTFCLHTTFIEPENFSCPIDMCLEKDAHHVPTGKYVELSETENAYVHGSPSRKINISGYYHACGDTAKIGDFIYRISDNFDHIVLYNGGGESGFLCVEPMSGKVNGLNMPDGHRVIAQGEKIKFTTHISRI